MYKHHFDNIGRHLWAWRCAVYQYIRLLPSVVVSVFQAVSLQKKKKRNSFRDREEEDNEIPQISGESHGFYSLVRLQRISVNFCSISFFCPRVPVRGTVSFNWHCWLVRIGQTNRSVLIGCHVTCNRPKSPQGGTCDLISENVDLIPRTCESSWPRFWLAIVRPLEMWLSIYGQVRK